MLMSEKTLHVRKHLSFCINTWTDKHNITVAKFLPMELHYATVFLPLTMLCLIVDWCSGEYCENTQWLDLHCITQAGKCSIQYIRQPPSTTKQDCGPYDTLNNIQITMECIVRIPKGTSIMLEIRWFMENTTGFVVNLGNGNEHIQTLPNTMDLLVTSRYHDTKFNNQQYNPSFLGKYWCQVINTTADPDQPLMRSNVFTLLPPDNYTTPTCPASVQFIDNVTCADLTSDSDDDQTSLLPVPTITVTLSAISSTQGQQLSEITNNFLLTRHGLQGTSLSQ